MTNPIPNTLIAAKKKSASINLSNAPTLWEWDDQFTNDGVTFTNKCKPFVYQVVKRNTNETVSFVTFNETTGELVLEPQVKDPLGVQELTLNVAIGQKTPFIDYDYIEYVDFDVEITECMTILDGSEVEVPDLHHFWNYPSLSFSAKTIM